MNTWIKTPNGAKDIPVGDWCVVMIDGDLGYCQAWLTQGSIPHIINGSFHYDSEKVVAYTAFPVTL